MAPPKKTAESGKYLDVPGDGTIKPVANPETESDPNWIYFRHQETDNTCRAPRQPGVLQYFLTRGWLETAPVGDDVPVSVPPRPEDGELWVTLFHPGVDGVHEFPNNADALAGAYQAGWTNLPDTETHTKSADPVPAEEKKEVKTDG